MRSTYEERVAEARGIERTIVQGAARLCSGSAFGRACKGLWPFKTAEELASRVGCAVRTAAYEISNFHFLACHCRIVHCCTESNLPGKRAGERYAISQPRFAGRPLH